MKLSFIVILILFSLGCTAYRVVPSKIDCDFYWDTVLNRNVYTTVDEFPSYPGDMPEFLKFFRQNFTMPSQEEIQGSINLYIVVDTSGLIIDKGIRNKNATEYSLMDKEAIRVLELMPKWEPGKCAGKKVPVLMFLPLKL